MTHRFKIISTSPLHPKAEALLRKHHDYIAAAGDSETFYELIPEAEGLIVRNKLPQDIFEHAPKLLACVRHGVGLDFIPVEAATARQIPVANLLDANKQAVVEHVIGVTLMLARKLDGLDRRFREEGWSARNGHGGFELAGKTLGVVGCGRIGCGVAEAMSAAFGMHVLGYSSRPPESGSITQASLEELFAHSDVVTLHLPSTQQTRGIINAALLSRMKPGAILINAGRGDLVDENALVAGLEIGKPAAAAIDVFEPEPPSPDHPFFQMEKLLLTPHLAGLTDESSIRMSVQSVEELLKLLEGEQPRSLINPQIWKAHLGRLQTARR